ncbi:MAG TPA: hypothetical protein PLG15_00910 [Candidatus Gastranaerophilaceae bacterium]|nr:hypothetical protein [Candidatus Gastranaerophilaceae bacterium]
MKIDNNLNTKNNIQFKGPFDAPITQALMNIDTNPMLNAALVDTVAMVIPRTYVDSKKRNKYAGAETFFREATGTITVCLSSGVIASGIAYLYNKFFDKKTNIKPNLWITNKTFDILKHSWDKHKNSKSYVAEVLQNISGQDGRKNVSWKNIQWGKVDWYEHPTWNNIRWHDKAFANIKNESKSEEQIIKFLSELINNKTASRHDVKNALKILNYRISNALGVSNSLTVKVEDKILNTSLNNLIRDIYDAGKNIFTNETLDLTKAGKKLKSMNTTKTLGALAIASSLGLINQYVNRQITKKRTGSDAFVGHENFGSKVQKQTKKNNKGLTSLKILASAGIFTLAMGVMKIKNPADFIKRLEFSGPVTSGNAIKTVYTATLIGRFLAAKDKTELQESATRDYLGFLNWLVLGGFVAKGVGQMLFDKKMNTLFNINKKGNGILHWLNDITPKSHMEIAAKGKDFAKENIWKINFMQASGLIYSTLALGFALPLLNIFIYKMKNGKNQAENIKQPTNLLQKPEKPKAFANFR